jgi:hypothetical protein
MQGTARLWGAQGSGGAGIWTQVVFAGNPCSYPFWYTTLTKQPPCIEHHVKCWWKLKHEGKEWEGNVFTHMKKQSSYRLGVEESSISIYEIHMYFVVT